MSKLKSVLAQASTKRLKGGDFSASVLADLRNYRKQQLIIFVALETFLVIAIVFCVYYITQNKTDSGTVKLMSGVVGIGAGGGVELVRRIWKEWAQTDLLVTLLPNLEPSQVNNIIDKLIKSL